LEGGLDRATSNGSTGEERAGDLPLSLTAEDKTRSSLQPVFKKRIPTPDDPKREGPLKGKSMSVVYRGGPSKKRERPRVKRR